MYDKQHKIYFGRNICNIFVYVCVNQYVSCICIVKLRPICVHVPTLKLI